MQVAVVSLSARASDGDDARYLEWHLLDHLPEQHRIAGMRNGTRWASTPACRAARAAAVAPFDQVDHVVAYLFAPPVAPALDTFFALGADLRHAGRMPVRLPPVELAGYTLARTLAAPRALVGADVLPWRPCRGVYFLLEQGPAAMPDALVDVAGVAGVWSFSGGGDVHERLADTGGRSLHVLYLDDEPDAVAERLAEPLRTRWADAPITALLAAPFVTVRPFAWHDALPT